MLARRLPAIRSSLRSIAQQSRSASAITLNSDHTLNVSSTPGLNRYALWPSLLPSELVDCCLQVPNDPIIPFIEGDGTGPDIWAASQIALDGAVEKAYGGERKISWMEVYAGEKSFRQSGQQSRVTFFDRHVIRLPLQANGCLKRRWMPIANTWSASRLVLN